MGFKVGLEVKGATKEKKELFFSGLVFLMQGNGQRRKQCYQIEVRGERTNIIPAVHTEGFSLSPSAWFCESAFRLRHVSAQKQLFEEAVGVACLSLIRLEITLTVMENEMNS